MIFDTERNAFESEKERNLYTKFFAGYFLNEMIIGYRDRVDSLSLLITERLQSHQIISSSDKIILDEPHVSFDNYAYLLLNTPDNRGEFADVLIHDPKTGVMIALEVKFLTNFDTDKDCESNLKRINDIMKENESLKLFFLLLIPREKWDTAEVMINHLGSNATRYKEVYKNKVGLLFWDELIDLCSEEKVKSFMLKRLNLVNKPKSDRKWSISVNPIAADS